MKLIPLLLCSWSFVTLPSAQEMRRPPQPLPRPGAVVLTLAQIRATIVDGASTTEVIHTLRNQSGTEQEADWLLPLPPGAATDRFTMTVNGKEMPSEVLDRDRARAIYEEIVRRRRDPGLLEYHGNGMLRARVYPIPAGGEVQVKVRFSELLPSSGGVTTWRHALRAAWFNGMAPHKLSLSCSIESRVRLCAVHSPLPGLDIVRDGDHKARASLEIDGGQMPPRDLELHYGTSDQDFGLHLFCDRNGSEGSFVMLLSPKRDWPEDRATPRHIQLVIDTSGSMAGAKIEQARAAIRTFLGCLSPHDRFDVIPFSTEARSFFGGLVAADAEHLKEAQDKVAQLQAIGGTNIEDALNRALANSKAAEGNALPLILFLTDGLPTVGTTDVDRLLEGAKRNNPNNARIFVFGVGHDVNTRLLDTLCAQNGGDRDYVLPAEDIEVKCGVLFRKLKGPVMTDLELIADGIELQQMSPTRLPDLFASGQLTVVGRYRGDGHKALRLRGKVGGTVREYVFDASFPAQHSADWVTSTWAQRRVAMLLDAIRLQGNLPELVQEVTRLGKTYGVLTPYTSHLILEEGDRIAQQRGVDPGARFRRADGSTGSDDFFLGGSRRQDWAGPTGPATGGAAAPAAPSAERVRDEAGRSARFLEQRAQQTGEQAVLQSVELKKLQADGGVVNLPPAELATSRTFRKVGAFRLHFVQGVWVHDAYDKDKHEAKLQRIESFSPEWFELLRARPQLREVLAFATSLVVVDGDQAFEIR